ncbi:MAG TPA: Holliday junction resolvase RuvX [Candidatus Sulfomarinibacteraceae bacterium]|nr:Holliday junction resolvase RuvX [Candidatus Sulfomarinibacteraceae bacterium]
MTRLLGIDLGDRRIGLAIAEVDREPALPLATIRRSRTVAEDGERLATVVREQRVDELVVGLPLEARGTEGTMAASTRAWAAAVGEALGLPVAFRDERLSSHRAEERLGPMPRGRSGGPPTPAQREAYRARVDREAAALILRDEIEARADGIRTAAAAAVTLPPERGGAW